MPSIVALIPARFGSKRVPGKNIRPLGGKPLMAWAIEAAKESGIFAHVYVCTDDIGYGAVAQSYGAIFLGRTASGDDEPDIVWVREALKSIRADAFAILRPTSPFRTAETICRAWEKFLTWQPADSLRAVERVKQHPGKMWVLNGLHRLTPLLPFRTESAQWHSSPTQSLPLVYVQNASLEIAWCRTVRQHDAITGSDVLPFFTEGHEGFDINTEADFALAEKIAQGVLCQS